MLTNSEKLGKLNGGLTLNCSLSLCAKKRNCSLSSSFGPKQYLPCHLLLGQDILPTSPQKKKRHITDNTRLLTHLCTNSIIFSRPYMRVVNPSHKNGITLLKFIFTRIYATHPQNAHDFHESVADYTYTNINIFVTTCIFLPQKYFLMRVFSHLHEN